jgi:hypothetical protein
MCIPLQPVDVRWSVCAWCCIAARDPFALKLLLGTCQPASSGDKEDRVGKQLQSLLVTLPR